MKGIIRGRRRHKMDGSRYYYYDFATRERKSIPKEELFEIGKTLPVKVKQTVRKIDLFKVPMTPQEQQEATLLCCLSIYCWKGGPNMNMPGISMEDYTNEFYIEMVRAMKNWNPEKGPWGNYVRFVRLSTVRQVFKRWESIKREAEVRNYRNIENSSRSTGGVREIDWESLQKLGLQGSGGHQVVTQNSP